MKKINDIGYYEVDDKSVVIVSGDYHGVPELAFPYDVLIVPEETLNRYRRSLIPEHTRGAFKDWHPTIRTI